MTTYRPGVYVVDSSTDRLGRVVSNKGPFLQLRPPGGGREWNCPPAAARLATQQERRAAGITANGNVREVPAP